MTIFYFNLILGVVCCFVVLSNSQLTITNNIPLNGNADADNGIKSTFNLLEKGDQNIILKEHYRIVTLILGNTGSGKSTLIQWLAGDNRKLISKEVEENTGEYIIEDGNRIGSSTDSKTIYPELVIDRQTDAAYYDCPGFSDTRNSSYDIASTYFIKKITDHAQNVKIVLTVSYPSVRKGVNRQDFLTLIRHTTELIKNIDKFQNSIAIVITKVDNSYNSHGLVRDENIARAVGKYLQEVKQDLQHKASLAIKENTFWPNAIQLLKILQEQKNGKYTRIGIFRRPNEPGPLNQVALLQMGKHHIESILYEELTFTAKKDNDFGYTISEESKNYVKDLVENINDRVWDDLSEISGKVEIHYRNKTEELSRKINLFVQSSNEISAEKGEAQEFAKRLKTGLAGISRLVLESKHIANITELAEKIDNVVNTLGVLSCTSNVRSLLIRSNYFDFLQLVSNRRLNLNVKSFSTIFQKIETNLSGFKKDMTNKISKAATTIIQNINNLVENIAKDIEQHYQSKMNDLGIKKSVIELHQGSHVISNLLNRIDNSGNALAFSNEIRDNTANLGLAVSSKIEGNVTAIFNKGKYMKFLQILHDDTLTTWSSEWQVPFYKTMKFLQESEKWYIFLNSLYAKLSEYDVQENTRKYNVKYIDDWGIDQKPQGININEYNFKLFLTKVKHYDIREFDFVANMTVTASQLQALNSILQLTLNPNVKTHCSKAGKLSILGNFVRFSDFTDAQGKIKEICDTKLTSLEIFSSNTVFIDTDMQETGSMLNVVILSPNLQVVGVRKIVLDGSPGLKQEGFSCVSDNNSKRGLDGKPGLPGGPGGNFLAISYCFINGDLLTVSANGGKGGEGYVGGPGKEGSRGKDATTSENSGKVSTGGRDFHSIIIFTKFMDEYRFYGKPGEPGGRGGDGGIGGFGGSAGKVRIITLNEISKQPTIRNDPGPVGQDGKGGIGGIGGSNGDDLLANYCKVYFFFCPLENVWCAERTVSTEKTTKAVSGANGLAGQNLAGRQPPQQPAVLQNIADIVNTYKINVPSNVNDTLKVNDIITFVNKLESNRDVELS